MSNYSTLFKGGYISHESSQIYLGCSSLNRKYFNDEILPISQRSMIGILSKLRHPTLPGPTYKGI